MQLMRVGQAGEERPAVRVSDDSYIDVSDVTADFDERFFNGVQRQHGSTATMLFSPTFIVHYLSQFMVLEPGDLINTGTPPGVGMGFNPPIWLQPGDVMELGIDQRGTQRQTVLPASVPAADRSPAGAVAR